MQKVSLLILTIVTALLITTNCKKTPDTPSGNTKIDIGETTIDSISYSMAKVTTNINSTGGRDFVEHGHCWSKNHVPTVDNDKTNLGKLDSSGLFSSIITNLDTGSTYYIRAYVKFEDVTVYGDEDSLHTLITGKPLVTTTEIINITNTSATCGGINDNGGFNSNQRGICWNVSGNPTLENNLGFTSEGVGTGSFSSNIDGLDEGTTYYVSAYATNDNGSGYGEVRQFNTLVFAIPGITTSTPTNITENSITSGGEVTHEGNTTVTERGICWDITGNPTLENNLGFTNEGSGIGSFSSNVNGLNGGTTYHVSAYATNVKGTSYGEIMDFTTLLQCGQYTVDYGGQVYHTVQVGEQCWFKENLNYEIGNSWCYGDNSDYCDVYGRLYDWATALSACPSGWHLPSDEEWKILEGNADTQYGVGNSEWDGTSFRGFDAGYRLKSATGWEYGSGSDAFGFSLLPGGKRSNSGSYNDKVFWGYWWTSTESGSTAWDRDLYHTNGKIYRSPYNSKGAGLSVRCMRD